MRLLALWMWTGLAVAQHVEPLVLSDRQLVQVAADSSGNIVTLGVGAANICGTACIAPAFGRAYVISRHDPSGAPLSETPLAIPADNRVAAFRVDGRGRVYLATSSTSPRVSNIYRFGEGQWSADLGDAPFELWDLAIDPQGGVVAVGSDDAGVRALRLDETGRRTAEFLIPMRAPAPRAVAIGPGGDVYIAGFGSGWPSPCDACIEGFAARVHSSLAKLVYAVRLGEVLFPASIAVTKDGSAYVGGSLLVGYASDFSGTAGAFQETLAGDRIPFAGNRVVPAPSAGFVARVDAGGAGLLAATLVAGNYTDGVSDVRLDGAGRPLVFGVTSSPEFPATGIWRKRCRPEGERPRFSEAYAMRLDPMLSRVEYSAVLPQHTAAAVSGVLETGSVYAVTRPSPLADAPGGPAARVLRIDFVDETSPVTCVVNGASMLAEDAVVPGQLLTLFGEGLGSDTEVRVGGVPAPILAAADGQLNAVVPADLAGHTAVEVLRDGRMLYRWPMGVVAVNPSPLLRYGRDSRVDFDGAAPLADAINEDGSVNDADHPAPAGSIVTVYCTGLSDRFGGPLFLSTDYGAIEAAGVERAGPAWRARFLVPPLPGVSRLRFRLGPPLAGAPMSNFLYVRS